MAEEEPIKSVDEEEEDDDFADISETPEYSVKSEFSKARIADEKISKTWDLRAVEMREGYYNFKFDKNGNSMKIWNPDTRKVFCAAVEGLIALFIPEIYRDERAKEVLEYYENKKKEIKSSYIYKERLRIVLPNGEPGWKFTGREYIPEIDEPLPSENRLKPMALKYEIVPGLWNNKVNSYWNEMLELCDSMFAELNLIVDKINYFKQQVSF